MKSLKNYISEKLIINKNYKMYNYYPKNKDELKDIIKEHYNKGIYNLNDIDVSEIDNFSGLFFRDNDTELNGFDISEWNVSNGRDFTSMFYGCQKFNCDLSKWNVSKGIFFNNIFYACQKFNCDLSKWDVSEGLSFSGMFYHCETFNCDLSNWTVNNGTDFSWMFAICKNFNSDLSRWNISKNANTNDMFYKCDINDKNKPKGVK